MSNQTPNQAPIQILPPKSTNRRYESVLDLVRGEEGISSETFNLILGMFVAEVEYRAEEKMLKTGKLEGAHYAAMKQVAKEWSEI